MLSWSDLKEKIRKFEDSFFEFFVGVDIIWYFILGVGTFFLMLAGLGRH